MNIKQLIVPDSPPPLEDEDNPLDYFNMTLSQKWFNLEQGHEEFREFF